MIYSINGQKFDSDFLEHHGIKGMKWGIRRYQNPDGTWTEEGLKRRRQGEFANFFEQQYRKSMSKNGVSSIKILNSLDADKHLVDDKNRGVREDFRSAVKKLADFKENMENSQMDYNSAYDAADNAFSKLTTKEQRDALFEQASPYTVDVHTDYDSDPPKVNKDAIAKEVWFSNGLAPSKVYALRKKYDADKERYEDEMREAIMDLVGPDNYSRQVLPYVTRMFVGNGDFPFKSELGWILSLAVSEEVQGRWNAEAIREHSLAYGKASREAVKKYEEEFLKAKR